MRHLPNLITLLRLGLVPVVAVTIVKGAFAAALALTAARDPRGGPQLLLALGRADDRGRALEALAALGPLAGAAAYRLVRGDLDIAPTRLSKLNTVVEFTVLLLALAAGAGWIAGGGGLHALFALALATVAASGVQYVWLWGRKALAGRGAR